MMMSKAETVKELFMIEIQGEVQCSDSLDGFKLGRLEEDGAKCRLIIGNHILRGKTETLTKPLVLVEKSKGNLLITATIKKKFLFSERPAPIPDHTRQTMKHIIR